MGKAAISGNRIVVGANAGGNGLLESRGRVYALNTEKQLLWHFDTEGAVVAGPLMNQEKTIVFIATFSGGIYALNTETGSQIWAYQLPDGSRIASVPALSGYKLIVNAEDKKIYALDSRPEIEDSRLLWDKSLN